MRALQAEEGGRLSAFGEPVPVTSLAAVSIYSDACSLFICGGTELRADFVSLYGDGGVPFDPLAVALAGANAAVQPHPLSHDTTLALLIMAYQANADASDAAVRVLLGGDIPRRRAVSAEIVRLLTSGQGVPSANVGAITDETFARFRVCLETAWHAHATRLAHAYTSSIHALANDTAQGKRRVLLCIATGGSSAAVSNGRAGK